MSNLFWHNSLLDPRNQLVGKRGPDGGPPIVRSPKVTEQITAYLAADREDDGLERARTMKKIIDANRADHAMSGVPVYAHFPLPEDFANRIVAPIANLPDAARGRAISSLLSDVEPSARPHVALQLNASLARNKLSSLLPTAAGTDELASERRRADELDARDPLAALAHPFAYGLDSTMADTFGEQGALGDWGWRPTVPKPSNSLSAAAGETTRLYLEMAAPIAPAGKIARAQSWLRQSAGQMGKDAVIGGALSLAAEWAASRNQPVDEQPGWQEYVITFVSGGISGASRRKDKAVLDASLAIGTSILTDIVADKGFSIPRALGAGLGAYLVSKLGSKSEKAGLMAQGAGRLSRKFAEKYLKQFIKEVTGAEFELTAQEWNDLMIGLNEYWGRQWNEFVHEDDRDPFN